MWKERGKKKGVDLMGTEFPLCVKPEWLNRGDMSLAKTNLL